MKTSLISIEIECGCPTSVYIYYELAYISANEYENLSKKFKEKEEYLKKEYPNMNELEITHLCIGEGQDIERQKIMVLIFSCMSIEGFINNYGILTLGENFYKKNIERIGITEKLSIILAYRINKLTNKENALIKKVRRLFDIRNSLVHPKTKEFICTETMINHFNNNNGDFEVSNIRDKGSKCVLEFSIISII